MYCCMINDPSSRRPFFPFPWNPVRHPMSHVSLLLGTHLVMVLLSGWWCRTRGGKSGPHSSWPSKSSSSSTQCWCDWNRQVLHWGAGRCAGRGGVGWRLGDAEVPVCLPPSAECGFCFWPGVCLRAGPPLVIVRAVGSVVCALQWGVLLVIVRAVGSVVSPLQGRGLWGQAPSARFLRVRLSRGVVPCLCLLLQRAFPRETMLPQHKETTWRPSTCPSTVSEAQPWCVGIRWPRDRVRFFTDVQRPRPSWWCPQLPPRRLTESSNFINYIFMYLAHQVIVAACRIFVASCGIFCCSA